MPSSFVCYTRLAIRGSPHSTANQPCGTNAAGGAAVRQVQACPAYHGAAIKPDPRLVGLLASGCLILACVGSDRIAGPNSPTVAVAAVITPVYSETFTGTAGALTGSWTQQRTSGTINRSGSGVGVGSVNSKDLFAFWSANSFDADQYSQVRIVGGLASGSQYVQMIVRASGAGDGNYNNYLFYTDGAAGAGHTEVAKNIRGSQITLKSFATTFAAGDVIKISVVGNTITCYKNGFSIGSVSDASLTTGSPGVGVYGSAVKVDDWEGATIPAAPPPAPPPVAAVNISPSSATLNIGATQQLTAVTTDSANNVLTGRSVAWSSSNAGIATVDTAGRVTAVAEGSVTISATSEGKTGLASITVSAAPAPVATVSVSPRSAQVVAGGTQQFTAATLDSAGDSLSGRPVSWASDAPSVASVNSSTGVVMGMSAGAATITATSEGKSGTASVSVSPVPVATVTVVPASASIIVGTTQQLTATTRDNSNNVLTGRAMTWSSGNAAIATVNANGVVTGVAAGGPVTITATSEGKSGSASITVAPVPVASVSVSPSSASLVVGAITSFTATTRDANGNVLSGRAVSWSSDAASVASVDANTGVVTAMSVGSANITATSEGQRGSASVTVSSASSGGGGGPLHVSARNPRYFENASGQIVYLTGSHTWSNVQDNGTSDPPSAFNYTAYLDFLVARGHNFTRLWVWEQAKWTAEIAADYWFSPMPYMRTGPGVALDGKPKFDLSQFNQAFFDRVRSRAQDAAARGIYVSVMLFDGWSIATKPGFTANNPWKGHPFNAANNINGINGDANGDGLGSEIQTLTNSAITALQDDYVRRMIDAVSDLDNVLFEIDNEGDATSTDWQDHIIQVIRDYESTKGRHHPIGMTAEWPNGTDNTLFSSGAEWVSPASSIGSPAANNGAKVVIADTDHICGICGNVAWVWKSFTRGQNPILMDGYDGAAIGVGAEGYNANDGVWEAIRKNLGYTRTYATRMNLAAAVPRGDLSSTGYCLAVVGSEYLVFLPSGGSANVNLSAASGPRVLEWLNTTTGQTSVTTVQGGRTVTIRTPFSGSAVAYIHP